MEKTLFVIGLIMCMIGAGFDIYGIMNKKDGIALGGGIGFAVMYLLSWWGMVAVWPRPLGCMLIFILFPMACVCAGVSLVLGIDWATPAPVSSGSR